MPDSPFRTQTIQCPRCRTTELSRGELRHCRTCKGAWIPTETLAEHVGTMQARVDPKLIWHVEPTRFGLPCAVCQHAMEAARLFEVPVDRCHSHGVWFDRDGLADVLKRSSEHVDPNAPTVRDPFPAANVAEVGAYVALDVAAGAAEVGAEVGAGILSGVLDAIGGIFSALAP